MVRVMLALKRALPALALVAVLGIATVLVTPAVAEAQMDCWECQWGTGQPGPEPNCVSVPEGLDECEETYDINGNDCETSGNWCQELMFLDFSEDGTAFRVPVSNPVFVLVRAPDKTCDGVLLRSDAGRVAAVDPPARNRTIAL